MSKYEDQLHLLSEDDIVGILIRYKPFNSQVFIDLCYYIDITKRGTLFDEVVSSMFNFSVNNNLISTLDDKRMENYREILDYMLASGLTPITNDDKNTRFYILNIGAIDQFTTIVTNYGITTREADKCLVSIQMKSHLHHLIELIRQHTH